ncbi:DUF423 domain-containing protein [Haloflavibacter putidus]|uniref:DUF423 domain-containing protein n=1 Tax=Haloflavibacter putidus TaxID=2576776 RepID=A0A507ZPQ4_9FLAO|nr:DUF423 domain-containing protein [Haloflavibacter putidus]TQD38561.1 DUF423 domain-containing protein [Haloflavibacter putidus]
MHQRLLILGSIYGMTAVILGAFGAHGLEKILDTSSLETFEVGVRYQFYHALFALVLGATNFLQNKTKNSVFYLLLVGQILFSGSIYLLATNSLTQIDFTSIAFSTPIGGLLLIISWLLVLIKAIKYKKG